MPKLLFACILILCGIFLSGCGNTTVTGTETTDETFTAASLEGDVIGPGGSIIQHAKVRVRSTDYLPTLPAAAKKTADFYDTQTDAEGHFTLDSLDPGRYLIEINSGDSIAILKEIVVDSADTLLSINEELTKTAVLTGNIYLPAEILTKYKAYVSIYGLERLEEVDAQGNFSINVPEGSFNIHIRVTDKDISALDLQSIDAESGTQREVGIVQPLAPELVTKKIIINTTGLSEDFNEEVNSFPLLVRLNDSNFNFEKTVFDGRNLNFSAADGTPLTHQIESWNAGDNQAEIWVKVNSVLPDNAKQFIYMTIDTIAKSQKVFEAAVFDTADGYVGVYHFTPGTISGSSFFDASNNANHGIARGGLTDLDALPGIIANSLTFDGVSHNMSTTEAFNAPTQYSYSLWFKTASVKGGKLIGFTINQGDPVKDTSGIGKWDRHVIMGPDGLIHYGIWRQKSIYDSNTVFVSSKKAYNDDQWHYVTADLSGTGLNLYIDGVFIGSDTRIDKISDYIGYWKIGFGPVWKNLYDDTKNPYFFEGSIDEVQILNRLQSKSRILLNYETQLPGSVIVTIEK